MTAEQPVLLVELERDLGERPLGWVAELDRLGVEVVEDDLGRPAISRSSARAVYAEARAADARAARRRAEIERRVIAADEARRAALPKGIPAGAVPAGMTAAELLMASDPFAATRRQSVVEHALEYPGGATVYTPVGGEQ
jgi:anti-sigma factor RsiW